MAQPQELFRIDDEDGSYNENVLLIVSTYTSRADGQLDFGGWSTLVSDLICIRDDVLFAAPERAQQVALALAAHVKSAARARAAPLGARRGGTTAP